MKKQNHGTFDPSEMRTRHEKIGGRDVEISEKGRVLDTDSSRFERGETDQCRPSEALDGNVYSHDKVNKK